MANFSPLATRHSPLLFTPASPPASLHSTLAIECYRPLPKTTMFPDGPDPLLGARAESLSLLLRSRCSDPLRRAQLSRTPHRQKPWRFFRRPPSDPLLRMPKTWFRKKQARG